MDIEEVTDEILEKEKQLNETNKNDNKNDEIPSYFQNFINNHLRDLTQIYIKERKEKGTYGILLLEGSIKDEKVDVGFLPEINIEPEMLEGFKRRNVNGRIMHIMCHDVENPDKHFIIERLL